MFRHKLPHTRLDLPKSGAQLRFKDHACVVTSKGHAAELLELIAAKRVKVTCVKEPKAPKKAASKKDAE